MNNFVLQTENLKKYYRIKAGAFRARKVIKAVDEVSFSIRYGEILGLVGESGCGKTTIARLVMGLLEPTEGKVIFEGEDIFCLREDTLRKRRARFQMIFQDPINSFNPRLNMYSALSEPLLAHRICRRKEIAGRISQLLEDVGLSGQDARKYPHQFSGGQLQRFAIARAISLKPSLLVCDEPLSSLDVTIQARLIDLFLSLQAKHRIAFLFISHNLNVISALADRIMVMYMGKIVEIAPAQELYENPLHPYTKLLLSSAQMKEIGPAPLELKQACLKEDSALREVSKGHFVACP